MWVGVSWCDVSDVSWPHLVFLNILVTVFPQTWWELGSYSFTYSPCSLSFLCLSGTLSVHIVACLIVFFKSLGALFIFSSHTYFLIYCPSDQISIFLPLNMLVLSSFHSNLLFSPVMSWTVSFSSSIIYIQALIPSTCESVLFLKWGLARYNQVRIRLTSMSVGPNLKAVFLIGAGRFGHRDTGAKTMWW